MKKDLTGVKVKAKGYKGPTTIIEVNAKGKPIFGYNNGQIVDLVQTGFRFYNLLRWLLSVIKGIFKI